MAILKAFGPCLYIADGPVVSFYGFPYPTRMCVMRLGDGAVWVWSPVALNDDLANAVTALGPVRHIVSPNKLHHLFIDAWARQWPDARIHAPPGLARRRPDLHFDAALGDVADPGWAADIDQVVFRGSLAMDEVVFFHRASRTAIVGDLIQRHLPQQMSGWRGWLMRLDGLVGERGSTPREWRASFLRRAPARRARDKLLDWRPERLLIAHGECATSSAGPIIEKALSWI